MIIELGKLLVCDSCGHRWVSQGKPQQCAKCKSRAWNSGEEVMPVGRPETSDSRSESTVVEVDGHGATETSDDADLEAYVDSMEKKHGNAASGEVDSDGGSNAEDPGEGGGVSDGVRLRGNVEIGNGRGAIRSIPKARKVRASADDAAVGRSGKEAVRVGAKEVEHDPKTCRMGRMNKCFMCEAIKSK